MVPRKLEHLTKRVHVTSACKVVMPLTLVVSGTPPLMTAYSSGSRYLGMSSASSWLNAGVCSEGFSTAPFPAAIALICTHASAVVSPCSQQNRFT